MEVGAAHSIWVFTATYWMSIVIFIVFFINDGVEVAAVWLIVSEVL